MLNLLRKSKGFTLIEVVIVLAIAGLIFVIVFLAVSQAQAARRDTARKSDASRFVAAANQYASNLGGNIPPSNWDGATYYSGGGEATVITSGTPSSAGQMLYTASAVCGANGTTTGGTSRQFAVQIYLEKGGLVCIDNR